MSSAVRLSAALMYVLWLRDELPVWVWEELDSVRETRALFAAADAAAAERFQTTPGQWRRRVKDAEASTLLATAVSLSTMAVFG
jgi:uncharacterized cupin superfamily protein